MVYRLTAMSRKTKLVFFIIIWIFSALFAILGAAFIATAEILPDSPGFYSVVTPAAINLRRDLGPLESLTFLDPTSGELYVDVTITFEEDSLAVTVLGGETKFYEPQEIHWIQEYHRNGTVSYYIEEQDLAFEYWNGTRVTVKTPQWSLWFDVHDRVLRLEPFIGNKYEIIKWKFNTTAETKDITERKVIGTYFQFQEGGISLWFQDIARSIWFNLGDHFIFIAQNFLYAVAIGGGIGIITAFILMLTRISRLIGGKRVTYYMLKLLNGKLGRLVSYIPIFDFQGDFFVEERFVNVIDLSGLRSTIKELYKQRWYDVLVFPTALASILAVFFVQNFPGEDQRVALVLTPLVTPVVLLLFLPYFPRIWAFNDGGVKRVVTSEQGDIIAVKPLGKILRDGLGIIIGFSGILSLGALAVEVTEDFRPETTGAEIQVAGFTLDIYGLALLILWTVGLFFLLLGASIVSVSVLAIDYLQNSHLKNIEYLRDKSATAGVIKNWGSVTAEFTPHAKGAIYEKVN
ncbi:MAG: hypothetical protein ACFFE8_08250 [Candidatus Heimdallarchaeota archaeon]